MAITTRALFINESHNRQTFSYIANFQMLQYTALFQIFSRFIFLQEYRTSPQNIYGVYIDLLTEYMRTHCFSLSPTVRGASSVPTMILKLILDVLNPSCVQFIS